MEVNKAERIKNENWKNKYKDEYNRSLESKVIEIVQWDEISNVEQMWKWVNQGNG